MLERLDQYYMKRKSIIDPCEHSDTAGENGSELITS